MQRSNTYTIGFAAAICLVCGVIVAGFAVGLKERQEENAVLDRQKKVLIVAGLMRNGEQKTAQEIQDLFKKNIEPRIVVLKTGQYNDKGDVNAFDQQKLTKDPATSIAAPTNKAGVPRVPNEAMVYIKRDGKKVDRLILPVEGKGLWSTLYGYIALSSDANTVKGLIFYKHGETPGLGGEIENPLWTGLWPGKRIFEMDKSGKPTKVAKIEVVKGMAKPGSNYEIDGLSGATITGRGVTHLVQFWVAEQFGPYLVNFRKKGGRS